MKFQGSNLDKRRVKAQIHKFYLQNIVSASVMSNSTEVTGELLLKKKYNYLSHTSKIIFRKDHYTNSVVCCPTGCGISTKFLSFLSISFISEDPILI